MATYLLAQDILNAEVSCFANYDTPSNPRPVKLITWLTTTRHSGKVDLIRQEPDKAKRDAIKATLPAITPSGLFTYRRAADLIPNGHSGLLQFDIDMKDNPHIRNYADLKSQLCKLPFVAYCGLSVSGTGYWGLVPIAYPERHGQHFDALRRVFAHYRINLDEKPRNVASLRGYSYDPAGYFAKEVLLFELYDEPKRVPVREFSQTVDADAERTRVEACISEINRRGIDITSGYNYWYAIGCDLASTFGENGRDYFHVISQIHPEYNTANCDKQYMHCLRSYKDVQLKAFFGRCRDNGVSWKELIPWEPAERTTPLEIISKTSTRPPGKTGKSPDALSDEVPIVTPSASRDADPHEPTPDEPTEKFWSEVRSSTDRIVNSTRPFTLEADEQAKRISMIVQERTLSPQPVHLPALLEYTWQLFSRPPLWWNKIAAHKALLRCLESETAEPVVSPVSTEKPAESQIERLIVEPVDSYPAEWDQPNPVGAVPQIKAMIFFEWQRSKESPFNKLGLASLPSKQQS